MKTEISSFSLKTSIYVALSLLVAGLMLFYFTHATPVNEASPKRTIYLTAIEPKGTTHIEKAPFPHTKLPEGEGFKIKPPDKEGFWQASAYRWEPGFIVAYEGEQLELHFFGINGSSHHSKIEGYDIPFVVKRGELTTVSFSADKTGIFNIVCYDHLPAMQAQLLILPAANGMQHDL
jgi:hypothetical protein